MSGGRKTFQARGSVWCRPCAKLYIDSPYGVDPITGYDLATCMESFTRVMKDPTFRLVCTTEDDVLKAFLLCRIGRLNLHSNVRGISQEYYVTSETGFKAARILRETHDYMLLLGAQSGAAVAVSHCSHMDKDQILCKLLHKAGWERAGHYVYKHLPKVAPARTQVVAGCGPHLQLGPPPGQHETSSPAGR